MVLSFVFVVLLVGGIVLLWPVREKRIAARASRIDDAMPAWQFNEVHSTHINATPEIVFAAIHKVTADDIRFFQTLTRIRRMGRPLPAGILNAPPSEPILDVATRTSFHYVADESPREIVVQTTVARGVTAVMNFLITPDGHGGSITSTETRVFAANKDAAWKFALYWRVIHPGSDIIRRMWLRAIKRRAEGVV